MDYTMTTADLIVQINIMTSVRKRTQSTDHLVLDDTAGATVQVYNGWPFLSGTALDVGVSNVRSGGQVPVLGAGSFLKGGHIIRSRDEQ